MSVKRGRWLGDTGEVKDNKEKKHFSIETLIDELIAVETMTTVLMGLATVMCRVVIKKKTSLQAT